MQKTDLQSYALNEVIYISNRNRFEKLLKKDILYIEAQGAYVDIYAISGKKNLSTHLKSFLSQIGDTTFIQVSRKHAVNIIHIQEILSDSIIIGKQIISTSKMYRNNLLEKLPIIRSKP